MAANYNVHRLIEDNQEDHTEELQEFFNRLAPVFWSEVTDRGCYCTFCGNEATHYNQEIVGLDEGFLEYPQSEYSTEPLYICGVCMYDLETGEVDIEDCDSHRLSEGLREIVHHWIDHYYYIKVRASVIYDDYNFPKTYCTYCSDAIQHTNDEVVVSACGNHVVHEHCARRYGFRYNKPEFEEILCHFDHSKLIPSLHDVTERCSRTMTSSMSLRSRTTAVTMPPRQRKVVE